MRKTIFILFALLCVLHFAQADGSAPIPQPQPMSQAEVSARHAPSQEWRCERECNSDLNFSRTNFRAASPLGVPALRLGQAWTCRADVGHGLRAMRGAKASTKYFSSHLFAGQHAADYYVFRLRRLII